MYTFSGGKNFIKSVPTTPLSVVTAKKKRIKFFVFLGQ